MNSKLTYDPLLKNRDARTRWRFGFIAAAIVTLIAIAPQLLFYLSGGNQWQRAYAQTHGDEAVYAAYLNALIDGRPRRNNPYSGRDDAPDHPAAESIWSVQFVPPLVLAKTARLLHLSTANIFVALTALTAFASALAIFWLLVLVLKDDRLAAVGVLVVLLAGSANLLVAYVFRTSDSNNYLPFLRRYLPAFSFPLVFVYCALVWRMLTTSNRRVALFSTLIVGFLFALLTFSYFYHWSFALAWTICLAGTWLFARQQNRRSAFLLFLILAACMLAALAPYFFLLSRLGATTAEIHFLARSHAPDLFRLPEILAFVVLIVIVLLIRRRRIEISEPSVIFIIAFALTPFVLFNQQVLTGRSLQPFHYEIFIGNYTTVFAAFVIGIWCLRPVAAARPAFSRWLVVGVVAAAILAGSLEATLLFRRQRHGNIFRDEAGPALLRLAELGRKSVNGTLDHSSIVFAPNIIVADTVPTIAPQPVLWAQYLFVFPDVTLAEDKERLAQFLYYQGITFTDIDRYHFESLDNDRRYYLSSLIGRARFNARLSVNWKPITPDEVQGALDYYASYVATFDRRQATTFRVSYLLVAADDSVNLSNFNRWYESDQGERIGKYLLYRVRLRS